MKRTIIILILTGLLTLLQAKEEVKVHKGIVLPHIDYPMKEGKGMYATKGRCNMCHSWGYTLNQGKQSRKFWERKVIKMITVFKAPIKQEDIKEVVDYLYENYGNGEEE